MTLFSCIFFFLKKLQLIKINEKKKIDPNGSVLRRPPPCSHITSPFHLSPQKELQRMLLQTLCEHFTFGPWPASFRTAAAQGGGHNLRGQVEVISEILDALIGEVPVEVSPGKLFLHVAS